MNMLLLATSLLLTIVAHCQAEDLKTIFQNVKSHESNSVSSNNTCSTKKCPEEQTCCNDNWDCCPEPEAVCCKDKNHCCPKGYICDDQPMICRYPDDEHLIKSVSMERKSSSATNVACDDAYECPDDSTCCKLMSGEWGCCPLAHAACCDDHIHCCPHGHTCDTKSGRCNSQDGVQSVPWVMKTQAVSSKELKANPEATTAERSTSAIVPTEKVSDVKTAELKTVWCDPYTYCNDGTTCCPLHGGKWSCCPLQPAVCCANSYFCCHYGYVCDSTGTKCLRGPESIDAVKKLPASTVEKTTSAIVPTEKVSDVKTTEPKTIWCDPYTYCNDGTTCCPLHGGKWSCCPLQPAVCCANSYFCCHYGYACDSTGTRCLKGLENIAAVRKLDAITVNTPRVVGNENVDLEIVPCDASHYCPDENTCCKLADESWGCCPIPSAVCCSDHTHCCPSGYTCKTGTCSRGFDSIPWLKKNPSIRTQVTDEVGSIHCDGTHTCPDSNTCCELPTGLWGCCPIPKAICCSDHQHCCPSGYTCDTTIGTCHKGSEQLPWKMKTMADKVSGQMQSNLKEVKCDSTHSCPSGNTCCKLSSGAWGCCPVPNAVCCSDHTHCCPSGYKCQAGPGRCARGLVSIPWLQKADARITEISIDTDNEVQAVQCDSTHYCPSGNTCCKLSSGAWGCCPVPNAVCCSDHTHCCPNGYKCQAGSGTCAKGLVSIPWLQKEEAHITEISIDTDNKVQAVQCDSTHYCPSGNTCCKLSSGAWGCCPIPNAVCCSDHTHCCPNGYKCQAGSGTCAKGLVSIPWLQKEEAHSTAESTKQKLSQVQCDGEHYCPDQQTCCKLSSGEWGCCPMPEAVCCDDEIHCCPKNYQCDTTTGSCYQGYDMKSWMNKMPALKRRSSAILPSGETYKSKSVMCDNQHECPSGYTCCKMVSGNWGCCPYRNAVCCSDGESCCPSGTTCDVPAKKCRGSSIEMTKFKILAGVK